MKKYNCIVTGGTFDHFHKGHEAFLLAQFALSEKVLIGLTSDAYILSYKGRGWEAYDIRLANLHAFLSEQNLKNRAEISQIDDGYIPAVWNDYPIEAIAVTKDTKEGAQAINAKRKDEGKQILPLEIIEERSAEDGKELSSSRIRNGEINRNGTVYISHAYLTHPLHLPPELRDDVAKPMGEKFSSVEEILQEKQLQEDLVIAVGDVTTKSLIEKAFRPQVVVVDLRVQRKEFFSSIDQHNLQEYKIISLDNPAGSLTPALFTGAKESMLSKQKTGIYIHGEEDLAVLCFVLSAPLGYTIIYGQPHEGLVAVTVTEEKKNTAKKLVEKFTISASR